MGGGCPRVCRVGSALATRWCHCGGACTQQRPISEVVQNGDYHPSATSHVAQYKGIQKHLPCNLFAGDGIITWSKF